MEAERLEAQRSELHRLRAEIEALRASGRRLVLAGDADRRRVERELHNGIHQLFVAFAVNLQLLAQAMDSDPPTARRLLDELSRDGQRGLVETTLLAQRIYPALLGAGDLAALLRSAAADAGVRASVDVVTGHHHVPEAEMTVYLVWLSALAHAGADTEASIRVRRRENALTFDVEGDAADWDADLAHVRDRLEALGGQLTIAAQSDGRTRASGVLPLP